ncbi:alpha-L-rhamnosidase [Marinoscillum furvescens]|uniref:alpha-L-rhamnosidase n=1 Tax=Marinoscillum furvescens DSM 4134 TaxID=1122208 RepID=A0A3D9KZP0_MARFU|nr:alpha-L-rhamnosidase [Marinoscillum furvescens]RED94672.1 alpha-L-rhamnosidase [Marinoscillum furvescens DSM 4134]
MKLIFSISLSILFFTLLMIGCKPEPVSLIEVSELNVSFVQNVDDFPRISWKVKSDESGYMQSSFHLLVSDNQKGIDAEQGNVWDSEKKESGQSAIQKFSDIKIRSGEDYFFKVKVWDTAGIESNWSKVVKVTAPIHYPEDWKGKWITYDYDPKAPLPIFRKLFSRASGDVNRVRLFIAGPGFYEAYLNGKKIGKNVLDPGQTNYEDYTFYTAYDIDPTEIENENVLGVMLGNGWYNQNQVWKAPNQEYSRMAYGQPTFIAQLVIDYSNGSREVLASDESWSWTNGPIMYSNIYGGETYDATREVDDWLSPYASTENWNSTQLAENHPTELFEQFAEPIQKMGTVDVKKVTEVEGGKYIFDFGQNFAGWAKLKINGQKGQAITIRFAEEIDSMGNLDPTSTGVRATKVVQTSKYICKGEGLEVWEPRFTYHGFRYAEVSGLTEKPSADLLTGIVVYSSVERIGSFTSSEENINKLHDLANWTITSNIHSIPTDCPHRERCGWTGDAHALAQSLLFNYDAPRFLKKYMLDMRSSARNEAKELYFGESFHDRSIITKPKGIPTMIVPGKRTSGTASPDWGTAMVQLPWYLYLYNGDKSILNEFYPDMKTWVEYIHSKNINGIITHGLGDWCPPGGNSNIDCAVPVSSSAFHILDVSLMLQIAKALGKTKDADDFSDKLKILKESFNQEFYDPGAGSYGSQTGNAMALEIGIVPEENKTKVAAAIVKNIHEEFDGFLNTGIFGIGRVFKVLCENGYEEEVHRLLSKKDNRSFATMWKYYDATTLWEVLPIDENYDYNMLNHRSHSHPMQAGYDSWFYSGIAGINLSAKGPGFKKIVFKPYLTQHLEEASASYESPYGIIKSSWESQDNKFVWNLSIPENSSAEILVPVYGKSKSIKVNGKGHSYQIAKDGFAYLGTFTSGIYKIEAE